METRLHKYKGITFGYTTPIAVGKTVSLSILEIPRQPISRDDTKSTQDHERSLLIEPYIKEVIPEVLKLLESELAKLRQMTRGVELSFQWFYFDLDQQGKLILL